MQFKHKKLINFHHINNSIIITILFGNKFVLMSIYN